MTHRLAFLLFLVVYQVSSENLENATRGAENSTRDAAVNASYPDNKMVYVEMVSCALRYDTACLVGVAEDYLDIRKQELLAQADAQVARSTGRADSENTPSELAKTIEKLFSDLSGLFKNGILGMFDAREGDDELTEEDNDDKEDEDKQTSDTKDVGEERSKKKKKKKKQKLKYLIIFAVIVAKLCLLAKLLQTALLFKIALLGIGILGVSVAKLIILIKHGKQKTIYYENSHHDHHYEHDDYGIEDQHGWGRSAAQNLAYSYQNPEDKRKSSRGTRKKKRPHKIVRLVRKIMAFVVIVTLLNFLLKFYYAILAKKYLLISSGYFLIHLVKSWFWVKNAKHGLGHIEYEHDHHAYHSVDHHDHHGGDYDDEWHYEGPGHLKKYDGAYDSVQKPYEGAFPSWL